MGSLQVEISSVVYVVTVYCGLRSKRGITVLRTARVGVPERLLASQLMCLLVLFCAEFLARVARGTSDPVLVLVLVLLRRHQRSGEEETLPL